MHVRFLSHRSLTGFGTNGSRRTGARLSAAVAAVIVAATPCAVYADDWKNNASGSWHDPNSWVDGTVPVASDFAFFTNLVTGTVSFTGDAVSNGVTLRNPTGVITFDIGAGNKWTQGIFTLLGEGNYLQSPSMILSSGEIDTNLVLIGNNPFVDGHVTVTGPTSILTATRGSVRVGSDDGSNSTLLVDNGALVRTASAFLGLQNAQNCRITVTGAGSRMLVDNSFTIGGGIDDDIPGGLHNFEILDSAVVSSGRVRMGQGGQFATAPGNTLRVNNASLTLTARTSPTAISTSAIEIGQNNVDNTMIIENNATVVATAGDVILGTTAASTNNLLRMANGSLTLTGTGSLSTAGQGRLDVRRGRFVMEDGTATLPGLIANVGAESVLELNGGTVVVGNANVSNTVPLLVGNGAGTTATYRLSSPAGTHTFANGLTIQSDGRLEGAATIVGDITNNNIVHMAPGAGTMRNVGTYTINTGAGAKWDLGNNKLITDKPVGTPTGGIYDGVHGDVQAAYHSGAWDRPGLMTSMPEAQPSVGTTTIAVASAESVLFIAPTATGVFAGHTVTGATTLAVYTYAGDLNIDGRVDAQDYGIIDNWVQFAGTSGYANGDINYDGVIDAADYGIIDNTIQLQGAPIPMTGGAAAGGLSGVTAVPEPTSLAMLVAAAGLLGGRRRRQSRRRSS
jgi:T5SS/PEP-CTERM-associated repeat protein